MDDRMRELEIQQEKNETKRFKALENFKRKNRDIEGDAFTAFNSNIKDVEKRQKITLADEQNFEQQKHKNFKNYMY